MAKSNKREDSVEMLSVDNLIDRDEAERLLKENTDTLLSVFRKKCDYGGRGQEYPWLDRDPFIVFLDLMTKFFDPTGTVRTVAADATQYLRNGYVLLNGMRGSSLIQALTPRASEYFTTTSVNLLGVDERKSKITIDFNVPYKAGEWSCVSKADTPEELNQVVCVVGINQSTPKLFVKRRHTGEEVALDCTFQNAVIFHPSTEVKLPEGWQAYFQVAIHRPVAK